jgi:hypothetical protein
MSGRHAFAVAMGEHQISDTAGDRASMQRANKS